MVYWNLWDIAKTVLKGKFIPMSVNPRKNNLLNVLMVYSTVCVINKYNGIFKKKSII